MIKKILVALDPDSDTPVATRCAIEIAKRYDAEVVGLAVIDTERIEKGSRGGGIGSMYYGEKLREALTEETREQARILVESFTQAARGSGVPHRPLTQEGVPFRRIVEDMKYHDLLVVGREPHFFYGRPKKETDTLVHVVRETVAPTLVVGFQEAIVRRVLIAYDGSDPSARTLQHFAQSAPFGTEVDVEVLNVFESNHDESELILRLAGDYLGAHGFSPMLTSQRGSDSRQAIVDHAIGSGADLVVIGAHSVSKLKQMAFGSITEAILRDSPIPVYVSH